MSAIVLNGCGGGGGGGSTPTTTPAATPVGTNTITGIAAVGAPINGATVSLIDGTGTLLNTATTSSVGYYSISYPANKTGPFLIEGTGGSYVESTTGVTKNGPKLHSIADAASTSVANITPLTEVVTAQALPAGQTPEAVFAACQTAGQSGTGVATSCTPNFAALAPANVTVAQNTLLTALGGAITAAGGGVTDFIHQTFVADGTAPMDVLLDATNPTFTVVNNIPTVTLNTANGAYSFGITSTTVTAGAGVTVTGGAVTIPNIVSSVATTVAQISANGPNLTTAASVLAQIKTQMDGFASLYSAGLPTQAAITAILAPGFLMDGMNSTAYAVQSIKAPAPVAAGDYFVVTLATMFDNATQSNTVAGTRWVNATQFNVDGAILGASRVKFVNSSGTWLLAGNERAVGVNVRAESGMASAVVPATFSSDVNVSVDPTTAALAGIASVWVSAPSVVAPSASGVSVYSNSVPTTPASAVLHRQIHLCGVTIVTNCTNALDSSEYTITLKNAASGVIATYKEALHKAPLPVSALNATMFPTIGVTTPSTIAGVTPGAALSLSWTNPAGLVSNWVDFTVWDSNGVLVFQQSGLPTGNTFAGTLPAFTPPAAGVALSRFDIAVQAADVYGRQYVAFK